MTHQKVFQVRYRNPRNSLEIFWAQDVWEVGASFRFVGCRICKTVSREGHGVFPIYAVLLNNVTIPATMAPMVTDCEQPEWWERSQQDAEDHLQALLEDPAAMPLGQQLRPFTSSLADWISGLSHGEQDKLRDILIGDSSPHPSKSD